MIDILGSISWTVGAFIFVLGVMIFIHELGHYLMAKYLGIRVEVFSLGFGPRILGFRKGNTDYRISILPLGGYVKMAGENYDENLTGSPEEFLSRPKMHRFAVALAGPVMNLGLAVLLLAVNFMIGIQVPVYRSQPPIIENVAEGSPADQAGLQPDDRILSVDGEQTPTWEKLELTVGMRPNQELTLQVERKGEILRRTLTSEELGASGIGTIGVSPAVTNVVTSVESNSPAEQAGLEAGDEIVQVRSGGKTAEDLAGVLSLISSSQGEAITFKIRRQESSFEKTIVPVEMDGTVRIGIGIAQARNSEFKLERYGLLAALQKSVQRNYEMTLLIFDVVGKLITGKTSLKVMSGPIEIARFSGQAAAGGLVQLMAIMALISLNLGIFNLLPIPILDGGVIALLAVEGAMGRDISMRAKERIFQVGFIFLILLMGIVIINDIAKIM